MYASERTFLLNTSDRNSGLSLLFSIICIVDVFGVFPIITLPKAIINCGYYGILVVIVVCSTQIYTAVLLGRCWVIAGEMYPAMDSRSRYPYAALAEITYGKCLCNFVTLLLDLTIFGGGIPNIIVASQTLQLLAIRVSDNVVDMSYCYWIIIIGVTLCPILWFGSPKNMKCICTLSVSIVVLVFVLVSSSLVFTDSDINPQENIELVPPEDIILWKSLLTAYGIITFQFDIHPTILTIQIDMIHKMKLPTAIIGGFTVTLFMFGATTVLSSITFGKATQSSILETLPSTVFLDITASLTALQLCLTSAVSNNALYQDVEDFLNISREFNPKRCVLRTILMLLAIIIAQSVPRFDLVMSTIGGTLTGPLVFILPPLFYLKILSLQARYEDQLALEPFTNKAAVSENVLKYREIKFKEDISSSLTLNENYTRRTYGVYFEKGLCVFIIMFSLMTTVATSYLNFSNAIFSYSDYTQPCIYNLSSGLLYL